MLRRSPLSIQRRIRPGFRELLLDELTDRRQAVEAAFCDVEGTLERGELTHETCWRCATR